MLKTTQRQRTHLPRLAFGDTFAAEDNSVHEMSDRLSQKFNSVLDYVPAAGHEFRHRFANININGLNLFASAATPIKVEVKEADTPCLLIPFYGRHQSIIEGEKRLHWQQNDSAVLLPACGRGGEDGLRSILMIEIDANRLQSTAVRMLRQEDADIPDFRLDVPRAVALRAGQIDFGQLLRHLCERIDLHHVTHGQMVMDGLDESFYRVIAMMLRPDVFVATAMDTDSQQSSGKSSSCPPQSLKERFPEPSIAGKPLSSREFQLLNLLMSGKTYTQITDLMDVSLSTVQSHVRAIYRKLDAHSKIQAIHHAKQRGFI